MSLDYWDRDLIHERMKNYDIQYREIYDEIFDHISSAIEEKQHSGDTRKISIIFDDVVASHFCGYEGVAKLEMTQKSDYLRKVRKRIWANFMYYVNLKSLAFTVLIMLMSLMLPTGKLSFGIMVGLLIVAGFAPSAYVYFKIRRIKRPGEKKSLIYNETIRRANLPALVIYCGIWMPKLPYIIFDKEPPFKLYNVPPVILAFVLALMLIYIFSYVRLCKQELEQFVLAEE